ncbi:hypothetical protein [Mesorhizobium sp. LjNodule214]
MSALLVGARYLDPNLADDKQAIQKALEAYIADGEPATFDL